ncbi:hypothetical protein D9619_008922 [Psilocybe cf. subviscida]|uniref:DUF7598 domain-containing protein n=1 Tax=Psilocybe cf. subviscida TaxID=2480587 RepID=A0A8H5FAW7_9AGAR|nr:hypothetical protein D9619_008922 [Psilocybe cf. subviscida]
MLPPRGYVFIGLNAIRFLSVLALLLVFSSNVVTLANDIKAVNAFMAAGKAASAAGSAASNSTITSMDNMDYIAGSTVPNQSAGAFWAVLNRLLIIFQTVVLILSEFGFPARFFDRFFPILGRGFGLGALGLIQMLIGAAVLSHHVDTFTLVSAFFLFSVGCLNVFVGLIFRESAKSKRSVTSWREHAKSVLPTHANIGPIKVPIPSSPPSFVSNLYTGSSFSSADTKDTKSEERFAGFGFGRQGEKAAALKGFMISKPVESLPRYIPKTSPNPI